MVQVSIVIMVFAASIDAVGRSDISIGTNSGTDEEGINEGSGGAENGNSSVLELDLDFKAGRSAGCGATGGGGGVREGRGGSFRGAAARTCASSAAGSGSGGSGGLVGGEGGASTVAGTLAVLAGLSVSRARSLALPSNVSLTPVSRRASSGVLTTVAPEPRIPLLGCSKERTSLGSEIRVGLEGA